MSVPTVTAIALIDVPDICRGLRSWPFHGQLCSALFYLSAHTYLLRQRLSDEASSCPDAPQPRNLLSYTLVAKQVLRPVRHNPGRGEPVY